MLEADVNVLSALMMNLWWGKCKVLSTLYCRSLKKADCRMRLNESLSTGDGDSSERAFQNDFINFDAPSVVMLELLYCPWRLGA